MSNRSLEQSLIRPAYEYSCGQFAVCRLQGFAERHLPEASPGVILDYFLRTRLFKNNFANLLYASKAYVKICEVMYQVLLKSCMHTKDQ